MFVLFISVSTVNVSMYIIIIIICIPEIAGLTIASGSRLGSLCLFLLMVHYILIINSEYCL